MITDHLHTMKFDLNPLLQQMDVVFCISTQILQ